jgi:hypothetical protein
MTFMDAIWMLVFGTFVVLPLIFVAALVLGLAGGFAYDFGAGLYSRVKGWRNHRRDGFR